MKSKMNGFDIFLGGTHHSNWRKDFLKIIKELNPSIKCYDPSVESWTYESVLLENLVKQNTPYHVYVLSPRMIGVYSIAEMIDSAHENSVKTYFHIMDTDIDNDGNIVNWDPKLRNSIYAINNMLIRHNAYKATSLEDLANKILESYNQTNDF
jgi:hypothetical protein